MCFVRDYLVTSGLPQMTSQWLRESHQSCISCKQAYKTASECPPWDVLSRFPNLSSCQCRVKGLLLETSVCLFTCLCQQEFSICCVLVLQAKDE